MRLIRFSVVVCLCVALLGGGVCVSHAGWMDGKILKASQNDDGVVLRFYRNSNATEWSAYVASTSEEKAILAVALTAISLDATVTIDYNWTTHEFEGLAVISP